MFSSLPGLLWKREYWSQWVFLESYISKWNLHMFLLVFSAIFQKCDEFSWHERSFKLLFSFHSCTVGQCMILNLLCELHTQTSQTSFCIQEYKEVVDIPTRQPPAAHAWMDLAAPLAFGSRDRCCYGNYSPPPPDSPGWVPTDRSDTPPGVQQG